jgi:hypothetical protein
MDTEQSGSDVSAALAAVRRRARYLSEAEGSWNWAEAMNLIVMVGIAGYLMLQGAPNPPGNFTFGLVFLVSAISGWQIRRLKGRVDALTRLLSEIGYPGGA